MNSTPDCAEVALGGYRGRAARVVARLSPVPCPGNHVQAMLGQQLRPRCGSISSICLPKPGWPRVHAMASPHPRLGLVKHFFFPGFDEHTGGLLREPGLLQRRAAFRDDPATAGVAQVAVSSLVTRSAVRIPVCPTLK